MDQLGPPPPATGGLACVRCACCSLTEECTEEYIERVRRGFSGRWICGLCAEVVKDEMARSSSTKETGKVEEALNKHMSFCNKFKDRRAPKNDPAEEDSLICAVKQLLRRTLDSSSTSSPRSSPFRNHGGLARSQSSRRRHAAAGFINVEEFN